MISTYNFNTILCKTAPLLFMSALMALSSCDDNAPAKEDTPELITRATLTFTPDGGGSPLVVTATDPDGEGVQNIAVDGPINLEVEHTYTLRISLVNGLADAASEAYDVTAEVNRESDEHMFFFGWTNNVFKSPAGNGNIDNREDSMTYDDADDNGLPVGLQTTWTASSSAASGVFHILLKHQPDLKSASSTSSEGESDLDVEFNINIQ